MPELTMEKSQQEDDASFATTVSSQDDDLGSREAVAGYGVGLRSAGWHKPQF